jgi:hypothetical protein
MADELVRAWFRDGDLRTAIENVLALDPDDLAVRFVALSAYYRLATLSVIEQEGGNRIPPSRIPGLPRISGSASRPGSMRGPGRYPLGDHQCLCRRRL